MKILPDEGFTFDDLLIVPQYSMVESRKDVDTSIELGDIKLKIPIIAANMDTICDVQMAETMGKLGGLGILHRFAPLETILWWVSYLNENDIYSVPSIGVDSNSLYNSRGLVKAGADAICIDVAHGNSKAVFDLAWDIYYDTGVSLIVGNFATNPSIGIGLPPNVISIKVGIGSGSACSTRLVAGVGVPQASAIIETSAENTVIADGGIRKPADVAKAIGLGADAVMVGGFFAGTNEVPLLGKSTYRGQASAEAQLQHRGRVSNGVPEGASFNVSENGPVADKVEQLVGGLRSAMSYTGTKNIKDFQSKVIFRRVSQTTLAENIPHFSK